MTMAFHVLVTDYAWPSLDIERRILGEASAELIVAGSGEEDELIRLAPRADAILTTWKRVSAAVIDAAPQCRHIARYGIGIDNIDVAHATRLGIPVTNVPAYCVEEVTDHVLALLYALARRIVRFDRAIRSGQYPGVPFFGIPRIAGLTLGIVGYGNIGRMLGRKARALGMHVAVSDPAVPSLPPGEGRVLGLDALLAESDAVSVHAPLLPATRNLIGDAAVANMKPGAFLINTSRGGLVDPAAVLRGLESGRLGGAALDVYPQEPPDTSHPLFQHPHFIATPHVAFYSEASVRDLQATCAGQVRDALQGKLPPHVVNPDFAKNKPRVKFE
jgi:D-3-phosphoglycerate dehydrogenase